MSIELGKSKVGDPLIFGLSGFGFSLFVAGTVLIFEPSATGALIFALLVGFIYEFIGGIWSFVRGETYIASVISVFGVWLLGMFMLFTLGQSMKIFSPISVVIFCFGLLPPIAYLSIPSFKKRNIPLIVAFVFLWLLVLTLGLDFDGVAGMATAAGFSSFIAAFALWYECIRATIKL